MNPTSEDFIAAVATYLIVGFAGYKQTRWFRRPPSTISRLSLVVGTVVSGFLFRSTRLISIFGFNIYLNWILQAFPLGLLTGLVLRELKRRRQLA